MTKAIPDGYATLTPGLVIDGAAEAIDFYREAFGAEPLRRLEMNGMVVHAELRIGDSVFTVNDAMPDFGLEAPTPPGPSRAPCSSTARTPTPSTRGGRRGRDADQRGLRPVPRRPRRLRPRSLRPPLGHRHPHRGYVRRGDAAAHGGGHGGLDGSQAVGTPRASSATISAAGWIARTAPADCPA